jgi:predicted nucleic acid-binding protein
MTCGHCALPTNAEPGPELLVDTSVALALVVSDHEAKTEARAIVAGRRIGLSGHAAFETFSVLTRLPGLRRRDPEEAMRLLTRNFPFTRFLEATHSERLFAELVARGIAGGAVYDALVAAAARAEDVPLVTRDRRAMGTYRAMDVEVIFFE